MYHARVREERPADRGVLGGSSRERAAVRSELGRPEQRSRSTAPTLLVRIWTCSSRFFGQLSSHSGWSHCLWSRPGWDARATTGRPPPPLLRPAGGPAEHADQLLPLINPALP